MAALGVSGMDRMMSSTAEACEGRRSEMDERWWRTMTVLVSPDGPDEGKEPGPAALRNLSCGYMSSHGLSLARDTWWFTS
ncbi:hypothetical protein Q3G72_033639 [Acer saccharum]|nr:hypothetical protein Q3G72_033639 [Acer saccharum]